MGYQMQAEGVGKVLYAQHFHINQGRFPTLNEEGYLNKRNSTHSILIPNGDLTVNSAIIFKYVDTRQQNRAFNLAHH